MSILVDSVRISGFRGIEDLEIKLSRISILVGLNNSGKTSILKAMQLALGDYSRYLSDDDFFVANDTVSERIIVDVKISSAREDHKFEDIWVDEFGDKIMQTADDKAFVAIRTEVNPDLIKGGYQVTRHALNEWVSSDWLSVRPRASSKFNTRIKSLSFIAMDAQRDVHRELSERQSFVGKVLSAVKYDATDTAALEELIKEVNDKAVEKSEPLKGLKASLDLLNTSFGGSGRTELTPLPKKVRDLSKKFSVHFGDGDKSFAMEYHGMGTRSWASMLTARAFSDWSKQAADVADEAYFSIMAAEEPEAHLHPNSQRTLYKQLSEFEGQVIVSTHSPYIVGVADVSEIRVLQNRSGKTSVFQLVDNWTDEELRKLKREVVHSKGELFFSKAIVLSEGETEEQALPALFEHYVGVEPFTMGINFVGVGGNGARYLPYFKFAKEFGIPVFVFSDGEERVVRDLKKNYEKVFGEGSYSGATNIQILDDTDFEGYLFEEGFEGVIEDAINAVGEVQIERFIDCENGKVKKRQKTINPPCQTCRQFIFEDILHDFSGAEGKIKAMKAILDKSKPKYAAAVTSELCKLNKDGLPAKVKELFETIKTCLA